ncbi:hypothetical protein NSQ59_27320 [Margalitia sp. FSL K6-0131]|uniref:hypothetical protein n=1 Tax=Margalitia sp. FSL K6-0131 TaxID=2954604 RepID=UPI0030FACB62
MNRRQKRKVLLILLFFFIVIGYNVFHFYSQRNELSTKKVVHKLDKSKAPTINVKHNDSSQPQTKDKNVSPAKKEQNSDNEFSSKEVAAAFLKNYLAYNSKDPYQYIRNSQKYMTKSFYDDERENIRRQTLDSIFTKYISGSLYIDPQEDDSEYNNQGGITNKKWQYEVILQNKDIKGKTSEIKQCGSLELKKEEETWKVDSYFDDGGCV